MRKPIYDPVSAGTGWPKIVEPVQSGAPAKVSLLASMDQEQLMALAKQFAPIVQLHPSEKFLPCSVDWYLQNCVLHGPDKLAIGKPTVDNLPPGNVDNGDYWLEVSDTVKPGNIATASVYLHALGQDGSDYIDLQYWLCYGYNGPGTLNLQYNGGSMNFDISPLGEHWIDWEMVLVRLAADTKKVAAIGLSQHGDTLWVTDMSTMKWSGTAADSQPYVYASLNGHALYPGIGSNPTHPGTKFGIAYFLSNVTDGSGVVFDTKGCLVLASTNIFSFPDANWLNFPYRWGKGESVSLPQATLDAMGRFLLHQNSSWGSQVLVYGGFIIASVINALANFDDTNGVYGPLRQGYWKPDSFAPNNGYTGLNTNEQSAPGIVSWGGLFHVFFMDHNGKGIMHITSPDGIYWSQPKSWYTGINTSDGPCPVIYNNTPYIFFRDGSGTGILHIVSDPDGDNWRGAPPEWYIGQTCDGQPSAAVLNGNILCVISQEHGGTGIQYAVKNSPDDSWHLGATGFQSGLASSVVAFMGAFHLFYRDDQTTEIIHVTSTDGIHWAIGATARPGALTSAGPAAIVFANTLYVFYRNVGEVVPPNGWTNNIQVIESPDGFFWRASINGNIGLACDGRPAVAAREDGRGLLLVGVDHGGNGIMRSILTPNFS